MPASLRLAEILALLPEAAEAAVASLPIVALAAGDASEDTAPAEFVPEDARAVACRMRGLRGELLLLMSGRIAASVEEGPLGNNGLAAAVEPALSRASVVLDQAAPAAVRIMPAREVPAGAWVDRVGGAFAFKGVPLFDDEAHEASMILLLDDPDAEEAADADDEDTADAAPGYQSFMPGEAKVTALPTAMPGPSAGDVAAAMGVVAPAALRLLHNVEMSVTVELGRTRMTVRNVLGLTPGSVVELDRAAGSPVDLLVNGTLIARGEVVVIDEEYGVRISEIVGRTDEATG